MVKNLKKNMELNWFYGFFVIAVVQALKKFPVVNASIDGMMLFIMDSKI